MISVNMLQPIYLTKALLPILLSRQTPSAIVLTSSVISHVAAPGIGIYSSTKAAVATFTEALHYETKGKVDIMSWDCGSVSTKLNTFEQGFRTSTRTAVKGCLKDVSRGRRTFGCWQSDLEGMSTPLMPNWLKRVLLLNEAQSQFEASKKLA